MRATSYEPFLTAGCMLSPRIQPIDGRLHDRFANAVVRDFLDRFADKRLDQQGFSLLFRDAARHQIELERAIERTGSRAVAALHIVCKDFQLGLVVRLRFVGQQQRMTGHFGICFLGMRIDDDLAWEDPPTLAVENRSESFAAFTAARCVLDHQRVVHVLAISQEGGAADRRPRSLAIEPHESLVTYDAAAGSESEVVIGRIGANRDTERREPQRRLAVAPDLYMVHPRPVSDDELKNGVDLIVEANRPLETLDQSQLRARFGDYPAT